MSDTIEVTDYKFYQTFLNLDENTPHDGRLNDSQFRNYLISKAPNDSKLVKTISKSLVKCIKKPQRLLYDESNYYLAIDQITNTHYVCYRNLLMMDIDFYKGDKSYDSLIDEIKLYVEKNPQYRFRLYSTRNGIHAFLISKKLDYRSEEALNIMLSNRNDFYYIVYSYLRGWSVRLNRKIDEEREILYEYIQDIGEAEIDSELEEMVNLHLRLCTVFANTDPNLMHGG